MSTYLVGFAGFRRGLAMSSMRIFHTPEDVRLYLKHNKNEYLRRDLRVYEFPKAGEKWKRVSKDFEDALGD